MNAGQLVPLLVVLAIAIPFNGLAARAPDFQLDRNSIADHAADASSDTVLISSLLNRAQQLRQAHVAGAASSMLEDELLDDRDEQPNAEEDAETIAYLALSRKKTQLGEDDEEFCYDPIYRKRTLKVVKELPFVGLFHDLPDNNVRFEASGITIAKDQAWVVFDSFRDIARLDLHFNYLGNENVMLPDLDEDGPEPLESQFEGLTYMESSDTFLVVRETFQPDEKSKILSRTEEIRFKEDGSGFNTIRECVINFEFEDTNKGFEGIYYYEQNGKRYFMGLCESNYCKTVRGDDPPGLDPGHGRLVVAELRESNDKCEWDVIKVIKIPASASFLDYSVIAFQKYMGSTVAIASQEDAAVWVGKFDWENLEFYGRSRVFHFPRNDHCQKIYCNVEGLQFIDNQRVVVTSDKSKATQPHHCMHKDQSLAVMALPKYLKS